MDLWWEQSESCDRMFLRVGCLSMDIASLSRRAKWWDVWIELPGCSPTKRYQPLEAATADVERIVRDWFDRANTHRPATDSGEQP